MKGSAPYIRTDTVVRPHLRFHTYTQRTDTVWNCLSSQIHVTRKKKHTVWNVTE